MQMETHASKSAANSPTAGGAKALILAACLLVLATIALYLPVYNYEFLTWDDDAFITENWYVVQGLSWDGFKWAFVELYIDYWHPVTWLSHMLDAQVFNNWAGGHHLVNVGIHVFTACILLGFLVYTTGKPWASALVAGLFALHPLHVESVAWVSERKDVLAGSFFFLTLWAYAYYARRPSLQRFIGVLTLYALGLMSKPMLVTLPAIMLLLDYWPLGRFEIEGWRIRTAEGTSLRMLVAEKVFPTMMAAAAGILIVIGQQKTAMQDLAATGVATRLTNAANSYGMYIANMFWPARLAAFYPLSQIPHYGQAAIAGAVIVVITVIVFLAGKRYRFMVTGWFWYLLMLLPVIGIVQVGDQSHADRYTYLPLTGLFVMAAWLLLEVYQRKAAYRRAIIVLSLIALGALWIAAYRYLPFWRNTESLCRRAIAVTEDNYVMKTNLAVWLATNGRYDEAEKHTASGARTWRRSRYWGVSP
jgi:hypothetical protein